MKFIALLFIAASVMLMGCVPTPDFSKTPTISYNGILQNTIYDSEGKKSEEKVIISIDFEDGDGDLGATSEDRNGVYKDFPNYELITVTKQEDGTWKESIKNEDLPKWMPVLKTDGKSGPIKGKLDYSATYHYGNSTLPLTIKYKIRIRDRAFNVSNQITETDTVVVPGYR